MVFKLLINLSHPFIDLKFINCQQAIGAIHEIIKLPFWPLNFFSPHKQPINLLPINKANLNVHLKYIDELRQQIATFEHEPNIIENHLNAILSYFMPTNDAIQTWDKQTRYERLLILSQYGYYIKTDQNARNRVFSTKSAYGDLIISINLAKPEKTQAQIIAEKNAPRSNLNEPQCGICIENLNFHGSLIKPSRENLRVVYESLLQQSWFFQYSPYAYLHGHFVLNNMLHSPMAITQDSIQRIFQFIDQYPAFMLGSNADLPIVGGSLLGHNHFQGALDRLPIIHAKALLSVNAYNCQIELLHWPLNTIKVVSTSLDDCINATNKLMHYWKSYQTDNLINENNNTVTYVAEKHANQYICYVILRNNTTSALHPQGNYHFHADKFHIKQENIGLMEAAGFAILPGRLINEFQAIIDCYDKHHDTANFMHEITNDSQLKKHSDWINQLLAVDSKLTVERLLNSAADVFVHGLEDCQVFNPCEFINWFKKFLVCHPTVIDNKHGLKLEILNIGNIIKQIYLHGDPLLLEYANPLQYLQNDILLNAFVGPACGRIERGQITDNEIKIQLPVDKNNNYMHGMNNKWSDLIYDIKVIENSNNFSINFQSQQDNPDLKTKYFINNNLSLNKLDNSFEFNYCVTSNQKSLCNPTHHFYWTLNSNNILNEMLDFKPRHIWTLNSTNNPIGIKNIICTKPKTLKMWMVTLDELTNQNKTIIDHPFVLDSNNIKFYTKSIEMYMIPQLSELVIYTHFSNHSKLFKYQHAGICFESQYVPTSLHNMNTKNVINNHYSNTIKYQFTTIK